MLTIFLELVLVSFIATSIMTIFSYILSSFRKQQFREPQLLNSILDNSFPIAVPRPKNYFLGWLIHYGIGLIFTILFYFLEEVNLIKLGALSTFLFGIGIGLIGIIIWNIMLSISRLKNKIHKINFYFHLILGHLIFSICLTIGFSLLKI